MHHRLFKDGNPIVYGGAISTVSGDPKVGDEVDVLDHQNNPIGRGVFNPFSQYRVRMLVNSRESKMFQLPLEALLTARIEYARQLRAQIGFPSASNTVYRLVNGEGDRLGGLIIDVFDDVVVVQSSGSISYLLSNAYE